jgi:hypothetical protein
MNAETRPRSRYGYDAQWWEGVGGFEPELRYAVATRGPLMSLTFVGPLLLLYEVGVSVLGSEGGQLLRTGADAWMRSVLGGWGLTDRWLVPLALVLGLLVWQTVDPGPWRIRFRWLGGMLLESLFLAIGFVAASRLVDLGFSWFESSSPGQLQDMRVALNEQAANSGLSAIVGFLGAGIYEEALFRLFLIPALFGLSRLFQIPSVIAATLSVSASALLFALAHHAGIPGEPFTWYAFVFRWLAGIGFAAIFLHRGFGIAVGAHAIYDVIVGYLGWHVAIGM